MNHPRLYVAIDASSLSNAYEKARSINDVEGDFGIKINIDLIVLNGGVGVVADFHEKFGRSVFPDLKMWNGGRTMSELAVGLAKAGASLTNIYAQSGVKFMKRVHTAIRDGGYEMDVFGLGVLTHYTDEDCRKLYRRSVAGAVNYFARQVEAAGLDGYIQPGTCLKGTRSKHFKRLVPAVRPPWFEDKKANDQEVTVTPEEAFAGGADIVVCGSPVFQSPDPAVALARLLQSI